MSPSVLSLENHRDEAIAAAAAAIAQGQCIVLPTDTVYGIAANAFDASAVQALLDAKQRGRDMPPPVLVAEPLMLRAIADDIAPGALALAKECWPGALTLILRAQPKGGMELGNTGGTVAVRVPDHDGARALLRATGPLAVSSANVSGQRAALNVEEATTQLSDAVALYLDGGQATGGVASTIVDFVGWPEGRVVRLGAISLERLQAIVPEISLADEEPSGETETEAAQQVAGSGESAQAGELNGA